MDAEIQVKIRYYSALRLHSNNSMHTDCKKRSLARDCLGIALQMQGNTSRDSGRLNCYVYLPSVDRQASVTDIQNGKEEAD